MSLGHGSNIVRDGLILHLDAANIKSYPETGSTWFDISKEKYVFTSANPPTFILDESGNKCFEYSGAGKYFDSTTNSPFSGNVFSISVVAIISESSRRTYSGILTQNEQDNFDSMGFLIANGDITTDHWSPSGRKTVNAINLNRIYHVVWTIESWTTHQDPTTKIYVDGIEQATEEYSRDAVGNLVASPFRVGNWQLDRADMDFQGRIYSIMAYNKILSEKEVRQNFESTRGRYGI